MSNYKKTATLLIAVCVPILAFASTTEQLQTAAAGGSVAFVLVVEPGATGVDQARQTIESAMSQMPGSQMIESDRADVANEAFVQKYKLASTPTPLILVFASNGIIAGGNVASSLNAEQLVSMVPSPKKAEVLMAIQSGQAAYVTASRTGMSTTSQVADVCASACSQLKGKCVTIDVSMDDPAEAAFLKQLNVNLQAKEPVTVVLNSQGQVTGTFNGPVEVTSLVQAVAKKVSSACCPPGSEKTCPPTPDKKEGK